MKSIDARLMIKKKFYGVRKKLLVYSLGSIIVIISLLVGLIGKVVQTNILNLTIEKYQYLNEKVISRIENSFNASDEVFKKFIDHIAIQETLKNGTLDVMYKAEAQRMLTYIDYEDMARAVYIDNKGNVYGARLICFFYKQFLESDLYKVLEGSYSSTKWSFQKDTLFGVEDEALFIMRYIRHMEYPVEPGVLVLKMNHDFLTHITEDLDDEVSYIFWDSEYNLCYIQEAKENAISEATYNKIFDQVKSHHGEIKKLEEGLLFTSQEEKSQLHVAMLVPQNKIDSVFSEVKCVMLGAWLLFCILAVIAVNFFTKKFVDTIQVINKTMKEFNGIDYATNLEVQTNTELDEIAESYNEMLERFDGLMNEVKFREEALRDSELNSLMYQINPHFLYNTLDNIYMMARLDHNEPMEKMIAALSKFLRIGLSNGKQEISINEELQHIKSYLNIMQMRRNQDFTYSIHCDEEVKEVKVLKLILQPVVENSIKYGFDKVDRESKIDIQVKDAEEHIEIYIADNGGAIDQKAVDQINRLMDIPYSEERVIEEAKEGGYGIENVVDRLKLKYGDNFSFKYEYEEGIQTVCIIKVPKEIPNMKID